MDTGEPDDRKFAFALMLACPACAGGFFLAMGAIFGFTALAIKGFAGVVILTIVGVLWARNIWRRRNENATCDAGTTKPHELD